MKKTITAFAAVLLNLTLAAGAPAFDEWAAEKAREKALQMRQEPQEQRVQAGTKIQKGQLQEAAGIMGASVRSQDGEDLGEVTNLLLDPQTGQVRYVTVSARGGEQYAVPWQAVKSAPETRSLTLGMTAGQFRKAPEGANLGSREQEEEIFDFYGVAPYWEEEEPARQR